MQTRERLVLLFYTFFNVFSNGYIHLYSDEPYYWVWSKKLDFSYFDHPPMVAYIIKLTTIFGDSPIFMRLGSALLVSATAYILYRLAQKMFDEKTAVYTFYVFISSIIVLAASTLITPDIPLMFFTALMLYSGYIYLEEKDKRYALLLGVATGAMLLSKYTGVLVVFTFLLYVFLYRRWVLKDGYFYAAILLSMLVFSPVLYWNYQHDFISFAFQLNHGIAEEKVFNQQSFFGFLGLQFVLFHPLYLLPLLYFIVTDKDRFETKKVYLLLPFLFVLSFFVYHAAFKDANAQWAGPAYLSASILLGYYLAQHKMHKLLITALSISAFAMLLVKTPVGELYIEPVKKLHTRLGHIDKFEEEIKALNINLDGYNYLLIDDYHGSEVAYYFRKYENVLVLNYARFSNYNIWRHDEAGIAMEEGFLKEIPSLGKCLYIGRSDYHYYELKNLFPEHKLLAHLQKKIAGRELQFYIVEFNN